MNNYSQIKYLSGLLSSRIISSAELTNHYLENISEHKELNALVNVTADIALKNAELIDIKIQKGDKLSLVEGIPFSLKDNILTKGIETTCCSNVLKGFLPIYNATVTESLYKNGGILIGKNNMDEFAMGSTGENSCFGPTLNPFNSEYTPSGSSSGSACSVAASLCAFSLGSDTGGSIRIPASNCGLVGLKPTYGAVSRYGLIAYASSFDQIGPLCLSAGDCEIVFDAISGYDTNDQSTWLYKSIAEKCQTVELLNLKIGVVTNFIDKSDNDIQKCVFDVIDEFKINGAQIIEFNVELAEQIISAYYILASAEAASNLGRYDSLRYGNGDNQSENTERIIKFRTDNFGEEVKRRILFGNYVLKSGESNNNYKIANELRKHLTNKIEKLLSNCDVLLMPTSPMGAKKVGVKEDDVTNNFKSDVFTAIANLTGLPAISVPCGYDKNGLPVGFQMIAKRFEDRFLINVAKTFEQITDSKFVQKHKIF